MWNNSWGMSAPSAGTGTSWTMQVQTEDNGDEIETMQDMSTMGGSFDFADEEDESILMTKNDKGNAANTTPQKAASERRAASPCELGPDNSTYICQPYKVELLERQLFTNSPGSTRRTAIIQTLRKRKYNHAFMSLDFLGYVLLTIPTTSISWS